jgi:hypothetical protein
MSRYIVKLIIILFLTYIFFLIISVLSFHKIGPMVHLTPEEYSKEFKSEIFIRLFYYIFVSLIYNGIVFLVLKKLKTESSIIYMSTILYFILFIWDIIRTISRII